LLTYLNVGKTKLVTRELANKPKKNLLEVSVKFRESRLVPLHHFGQLLINFILGGFKVKIGI
jgi:hypothetical protein